MAQTRAKSNQAYLRRTDEQIDWGIPKPCAPVRVRAGVPDPVAIPRDQRLPL